MKQLRFLVFTALFGVVVIVLLLGISDAYPRWIEENSVRFFVVLGLFLTPAAIVLRAMWESARKGGKRK